MNTNMQYNRNRLEEILEIELEKQLGDIGQSDMTEEDSEQYHPVMDIVFLERLDADAITQEERKEMIDHLAECGVCRERLALLYRCGALFTENSSQAETLRAWMKSLKLNAKWLVPLSCCALLFLGVLLLMPSSDPGQVAYRNVRKTLNADEQHFSLQLPDNGYRLNGTSVVKAIPTLDEHKRSVCSAYEALVDGFPENIDFRTEYGKYLLFVLHDVESARQQLEVALEKSLWPLELKRVPELRQLLGIASFLLEDDIEAQKHFRDALDLDPKNTGVKVNLAVSLYRSGNREQALEMLRELRTETISETLRDKIDKFLDRE